nr:formimidoyltransferase-cyclodeaminase [Vulpes vulpes]
MAQLVECVPNFSEGNNQQVIDAISRAVTQTPGCVLLDVDAGPSTNRTVYTFVGQPRAVVEGALNAARAAFQLIDMSQHRGEHPRMGALDVCPFVPVRGVTMDECVLCAQAFGRRLAEELGVPVYLYGEAARTAGRRALPAIRAGEYEALPDKLKQAEWAPDFGPSSFVPRWGATATGARKFLIAFNVNLLGTREQAHRIALNIREQGRGRDQPGRLKRVQGIGWYLDEKNLAQVSTNLLDFEVTALHTVYEEICREAQELSVAVVGSQLVGLVPLKALLDAAAFYCERENLFILEEEHRVRLVVNRLGLDSLSPFNPKERIIESSLCPKYSERKMHLTPGPRRTAGQLGTRRGRRRAKPSNRASPVSRAARVRTECPPGPTGRPGPRSAGLAKTRMRSAKRCSHCVHITPAAAATSEHPRSDRWEPRHRSARLLRGASVPWDPRPWCGRCPGPTRTLWVAPGRGHCSPHVFGVLFSQEATKLPKSTEEERDTRAAALQEGLRQAVAVPLALADTVASLWPALQELARCGNLACRSDLQVAAKALETGVFGAYFNVLINLKDITDDGFKDQTRQHITRLLQDAKTQAALVLDHLEARKE